MHTYNVTNSGADPGFSEGGSGSVVDIEGGANLSIVFLKQGVLGVWGI